MTKIGLIAGGGNLPIQIINKLKDKNQDFCVISLIPDNQFADQFFSINEISKIFAYLKQQQVTHVVMAGNVTRPSLKIFQTDSLAVKLLANFFKAKFFGDDSLLSIVVSFLEENGFEVISPQDILGNILTPSGLIGKHQPNEQDLRDIEVGFTIAKAIGQYDIGQAIIVENGLVLGVEAAEGTDNLIKRTALLKKEAPGHGVLIKVKKPGQEERIDLPTIGLDTITNLHQAGFKGLALEAGNSFILNIEKVKKQADDLEIFIFGI